MTKVPVGHRGEDFGHSGFIKRLDRDYVQVASKSTCDGVPASSWGAHTTNQLL